MAPMAAVIQSAHVSSNTRMQCGPSIEANELVTYTEVEEGGEARRGDGRGGKERGEEGRANTCALNNGGGDGMEADAEPRYSG